MKHVCLAVLLGCLGQTAFAQDNHITVLVLDGNPHDRIFIRNTGACGSVSGVLTLDFTNSAGQVLIDTQYGGAGTKDPMPVEVEAGPLVVAPVLDGDRVLRISIVGLGAGQSGVVTLDVDNEAAGWRAARVSIIGDHLAGSEARMTTAPPEIAAPDLAGRDASAVFDRTGSARIVLGEDACDVAPPPFSTVPMG